MAAKLNDLDGWLAELRKVALEARKPNTDLKALNCFQGASRQYLSFLKYKAKCDAIKTKKD